MISFTLSRSHDGFYRPGEGSEAPHWETLLKFFLSLLPHSSLVTIYFTLVIKYESKENIIPEEMVPVDLRSV